MYILSILKENRSGIKQLRFGIMMFQLSIHVEETEGISILVRSGNRLSHIAGMI